tara:strand:+ start:3152 stop:4339 length:1188 start_codon:yes stop_codon:yes gene_type:complete
MKVKQLPYLDQLMELGKLYKIEELKVYARSKKKLTISQIELILLKNKIRLPEQSYNKKKIADLKFKNQVTTNVLITLCLITFVVSLMTVRPFIKLVTGEIKFTYVAKEYKSNFKNSSSNKKEKSTNKSVNKNKTEDYISLDTQVTLKMFDKLKFDLESIRLGQAVKPIYLSKLPKDLNKIKNTQTKKDTFIKIVMPLILDENDKILEDRKKLFKILGKQSNTMGERVWLKRRFKDYGIEKEDIAELKLRMDIVPTSIAIAQAAKESGWGTSRFALEGNAMYGQWTYGDDGIEPSQKDNSKDHKILKFPMLQSSVKAYMKNLNTHRGYKEFRSERAELRKKNKNISGINLVVYLYNYAQAGTEYVKTLKKIIEQNDLTDFDSSVLMNSGRSGSLTL